MQISRWSDQYGDFSIEFGIEKKNGHMAKTALQRGIPSHGIHGLTSSYRDICMKVTPQSIWIHFT